MEDFFKNQISWQIHFLNIDFKVFSFNTSVLKSLSKKLYGLATFNWKREIVECSETQRLPLLRVDKDRAGSSSAVGLDRALL